MQQSPTQEQITVNGPDNLPLLGNLHKMFSQDFIKFYYNLWLDYGDIVQLKLGPLPTFLFVRPDHIQHILVKNPDIYVKGLSLEKFRMVMGNGIFSLEGDEWKQRRRLMQPTYTPNGIRQFAELMSQSALEMRQRWQETPPNKRVNINDEMTKTTMTIISRAMFSFDISESHKEVGDALHSFLDYIITTTMSLVDVPLFIPTPKNRRLKQAKQLVREFIFDIIKQRRKEGQKDDLLSILMTAKDEETGEMLSDDDLHNEILITFFAGHETTATLLTWVWYLLAKYPHIEDKLHQELDSVLGGRSATLDDLPNLKYTRMVLDEALRLYSPVALTARDVVADDVIDGVQIPKGSMVIVMPYITHRHPDFWEHPMGFYPEHFTEEAVESRPRYAYYPFGAGRRICIGNHFAQMEATILLAELAQHFKAQLATTNDGAVDFVGVIRPREPLLMNLIPR